MQDKKILLLDPGHAFGIKKRKHPFYALDFDVVDQYDFAKLDLDTYKCISIPSFVDQEFLYTQKEKIEDFVNKRNILIFCGHLFRNWLPGGTNFIPKTITDYTDYEIHIVQRHAIFDGVETNDMTYNRGVAGFFARGYYMPPKGAIVLLELGEGECVTYIDRHTADGVILLHAGNDLFSYMEAGKTTDRISRQLLSWVKDEYMALQKGGKI